MRVFQSLPEIPALIWIAPPQGRVDYARLKAVLLGFSADSTQGRQFFEATAYTGMRPVSDDQMQSLDAFADSTKNLLNLKHER